MIVAVCVESGKDGMRFNGRRVSRDRAQQDDLLALCKGAPLWMDAFSAPLFDGRGAELAVSPNFLEQAGRGEVCFVEDRPLRPVLKRIEALVLYRWNRAYPSDAWLDVDVEKEGFFLTERVEFAGTSHEKITRELYRRRAEHGEKA